MEKQGNYFYCSFNNKVIAGVCGGLSFYTGINVLLIRGLFVLAGLFVVGAVVYFLLATYPPIYTK